MVHITAIPDWLEDAVGEAKDQEVLHRFLAEVMVDAINLALLEDLPEFTVERAGGVQVVAERFLHDDPAPAPVFLAGETGSSQLLHDQGEKVRRSGEVEKVIALDAVLLRHA